MPVTKDEFRRMALSFPGASESEHMGHPDFRINGKVFASLGYPDDACGMVKLSPEHQDDFLRNAPEAFSPAKGAWGRQGSTIVSLKLVKKADLMRALEIATAQTAVRKSGNRA